MREDTTAEQLGSKFSSLAEEVEAVLRRIRKREEKAEDLRKGDKYTPRPPYNIFKELPGRPGASLPLCILVDMLLYLCRTDTVTIYLTQPTKRGIKLSYYVRIYLIGSLFQKKKKLFIELENYGT